MEAKKDFIGYYITYHFYGPDGVESTAAVVIGENFKSIANQLIKAFSVQDDIYSEEKTIEEVMQSIENYISEEWPWSQFSDLSFKYREMKPKNNVEFFKSEELLNLSSCLKMGRDHFIDFDSLM